MLRFLSPLQLAHERLAVAVGDVPGASPPSDHGVVLVGLVVRTALHVAVLVGLEVGGPEGDGPGVERPADLGDSLGELVDELLGPALLDDGAGVLPDVVGEEELAAHQSDTVALELGDLLGLGGHGHVDHDLRPGDGDVLGSRDGRGGLGAALVGGRLLQDALVDGTGGSVDGDVHAVLQDLGGVAGSDDAGCSELPGDDGGVAGHASLVGDDGRGPAHGGDHVGHGHLGDEDVALLDGVEAHRGVVDDDLSRGEAGAGSESGGDDVLAVGGGSDGLVGGGVACGCDGPRLDDVGLVVLDAPLHVHGLLVVDLDLPSDLGDLLDAGVGDLLGLDHVLGHVLLDDPSLLAADVLPRLRGDPLLQDLHLLLVDHVGVGCDLSADDGLSETVSGLDDDLLGPAVGVNCEHDPGELGVDHPLHAASRGTRWPWR